MTSSDYPLLIWGELPSARQRTRRGHAHTDRCAVPDCGRRRSSTAGLCGPHWRRLLAGLQGTPLPAERAGARPSGYGVYGVTVRDDDGILCHECGTWLRMLTAGHLKKHGLSQSEYRRKHGLSKTTPLCCRTYSKAHHDKLLARPDITTAGAARLSALAVKASRAAAAALARDGVAPEAAARRARAMRDALPPSGRRPCPMCGGPMPPGEAARKLTVCSPTCESESKRRGAWTRRAREEDEPVDFARTTEDLDRVDLYALAAQAGVSIRTVHRWVTSGRLRLHDGRTGGVPWWYDRDLPRRADVAAVNPAEGTDHGSPA